MSTTARNNLTATSLVVGIAIGIFGAVQSAAVLPYRMEQAEKAVIEVRREAAIIASESRSNREILIRIESEVSSLRRDMQRYWATTDTNSPTSN